MKGNNTLPLCQSAMIDAIQEYINSRFTKETPTVVSVKQTIDRSFEIELKASEDAEVS